MWTETDFATTQDETTFDAREQFMGTFGAGCGWGKVTSLCLVTNPDLEPFFFEECHFSFFEKDTSTIRPASRCRICIPFLDDT